MAPPVGPTGLPTMCTGEHDARSTAQPTARVGASWGGFDTTLKFSGAADPVGDGSMRQHALVATGEVRISPRTVLLGSLGSALGGRFDFGGLRHDVRPGPLVGVAVGHRLVEAKGARPFVLATASLGASFLQTELQTETASSRTAFTATDARVGAVVGYTFGPVSPYLLARAFGGPIFWNGYTGTDRYHYNLGLGLALGPRWGFDLGAEASLLGERRATVSAGFNF